MNTRGLAFHSPRNATALTGRIERAFRVSEAAALRLLQYRNGFRVFYRCCCYSPAYGRRDGRACPWWAFPRARAVTPAMHARLVRSINMRRAS